MITQDNVNERLSNALDNGYYEITTWTPERIALDLISYSQEFEDEKPEYLIPFVEVWLKELPKNNE